MDLPQSTLPIGSCVASSGVDMDAPQLFRDNLDLIVEICESVCRCKGCFPPESEDFTSKVKLILISDDYARLRRFQGRSSLKTFLRAVVLNLFRDDRNQAWGRWRPSAEALRRGEEAELLEQLLYRDGRSLHEAVQILRLNLNISTSEAELREIAEALPVRSNRKFESDDALLGVAVDGEVDAGLSREELSNDADRARGALDRALSKLEAQDRLILKMHFEDAFTVTRIAKVLRLDRRKLYSRLDRCLRSLRRMLEADGIHRDHVIGWDGLL